MAATEQKERRGAEDKRPNTEFQTWYFSINLLLKWCLPAKLFRSFSIFNAFFQVVPGTTDAATTTTIKRRSRRNSLALLFPRMCVCVRVLSCFLSAKRTILTNFSLKPKRLKHLGSRINLYNVNRVRVDSRQAGGQHLCVVVEQLDEWLIFQMYSNAGCFTPSHKMPPVTSSLSLWYNMRPLVPLAAINVEAYGYVWVVVAWRCHRLSSMDF